MQLTLSLAMAQALTLSATDPLNPERNSKRPRVAP